MTSASSSPSLGLLPLLKNKDPESDGLPGTPKRLSGIVCVFYSFLEGISPLHDKAVEEVGGRGRKMNPHIQEGLWR